MSHVEFLTLWCEVGLSEVGGLGIPGPPLCAASTLGGEMADFEHEREADQGGPWLRSLHTGFAGGNVAYSRRLRLLKGITGFLSKGTMGSFIMGSLEGPTFFSETSNTTSSFDAMGSQKMVHGRKGPRAETGGLRSQNQRPRGQEKMIAGSQRQVQWLKKTGRGLNKKDSNLEAYKHTLLQMPHQSLGTCDTSQVVSEALKTVPSLRSDVIAGSFWTCC